VSLDNNIQPFPARGDCRRLVRVLALPLGDQQDFLPHAGERQGVIEIEGDIQGPREIFLARHTVQPQGGVLTSMTSISRAASAEKLRCVSR